jgi:hypothetical protein
MVEWCARHRRIAVTLLAIAGTAMAFPVFSTGQEPAKDRRPRFTLRARPVMAMTPATVVFNADLVGGADDYEEFYCPTIEWDWSDGTTSESTGDCAPYEVGKSSIRRRFTMEHVFRQPGVFKIYVRLKRGDKIVTAANVTLRVIASAIDDLP